MDVITLFSGSGSWSPYPTVVIVTAAQYLISKFQILITRLAQGIPIGGELDLLDYNTMSTAFTSRSEIKKII